MAAVKRYDDLIVVDGLNISKWSRDVFEDMRKGELTAVNCTCCVWENFRQTPYKVLLSFYPHWMIRS